MILGFEPGCARKPDDAKISSEIQSKFSQDSGLSTKQLTVQANDGVVTLSGNVDNDAQREAASRQAASVAGVKDGRQQPAGRSRARVRAPATANMAPASPSRLAETPSAEVSASPAM